MCLHVWKGEEKPEKIMRQIERETDRVHVWVSQNVPNANVFNYQCDNKWERDNQLKMILIPF